MVPCQLQASSCLKTSLRMRIILILEPSLAGQPHTEEPCPTLSLGLITSTPCLAVTGMDVAQKSSEAKAHSKTEKPYGHQDPEQ